MFYTKLENGRFQKYWINNTMIIYMTILLEAFQQNVFIYQLQSEVR